MSYVLNIWEQPPGLALPDDIQAVAAMVGDLFSRRQGVNPRFATLVRTLTQRFPTLDAMPLEEGADEPRFDECAWSDGSIDGYTTDAVLNLGINSSMLGEVQPVVVTVATQLGLCVLDHQAGAAYFPDGRVLSVPRSSTTPEPAQEELPRSREVVQGIFDRLTPLLKARGFKPRKGRLDFKRSFPGGWQEISLDYTDQWPVSCDFSLTACIRLDAVTVLAQAIASPNSSIEDRAIRPTAVAAQQDWMDGEPAIPRIMPFQRNYEVRTPTDVEQAIDHLAGMLERKILPLLTACETLEGIDAALNPPLPGKAIIKGFGGNYSSIIAAYLAHNPRIDEILAAVLPGTYRQNEGLQRCIAYVKERLASKG